MLTEKTTKIWDKFLEFGNTKDVSEYLGIPIRTVQYHLKLYREHALGSNNSEPKNILNNERSIFEEEHRGLNKALISAKSPPKSVQFGHQLTDTIEDGVVLVFSDAHIIPKMLSVAQKALLKVCSLIEPDIVINLGDIFDFSSISSYDKHSWVEGFSVEEELAAGVDFLKDIQRVTPRSKKYFLYSNHDCRFNKFLAKHAPQFKGIKGFSLEDHIPDEWINCMSLNLNKNTMFLHQFNGGVHAGYNNVVKSGISTVTGHTHILECKPFTDYTGTRFGIQTGTLAAIKDNPFFNYTIGTPLNWIAGFAILTYVGGELQMPEFCTVNNKNQAIFRGKLVD